MIKVSLQDVEEFLIIKRFKGLELGASKLHVMSVFGEPLEHEPQKGKNYEICSYGVLQIYLLNRMVVGFTFDYQKIHYYRGPIEYMPIDQEIILRYLNNYQIEYSENLLLGSSDGQTFETDNDISLGFVGDKLVAFGILSKK